MRLTKKKFFAICFLVVLAVLVWRVFQTINASPKTALPDKEAVLEKVLARKPIFNPTPIPQGWQEHDSNYFQLSYPSRARTYATEENTQQNTNLLDTFHFELDNPRMDFVAQVFKANGILNFADLPAVQFRRKAGSDYREIPEKVSGVDGLGFEKRGTEVEKSLFFVRNDLVYTFVISGSQYPEMSEILDQVMASVSF